MRATRDFPRAWERADELGSDVASEFWRRFGPYGLGPDFPHHELVVERLMGEKRFVAAIKLLALYSRRFDGSNAEVVVNVLKWFLSGADQDPDQAALDSYDLTSLFGYLNARADRSLRSEIAQLEWAYLPALGFEPELGAIQEALSENPSFFVQLLEVVYYPKGEKAEEDTGSKAADDSGLDAQEESASRTMLAENAYRLLGAFDRLPGRNEDEIVDGDVLKWWVFKVLELGQGLNRRGPAEIHVGQVLATAPSDADGTWPCKPVRDLLELLQNSNVESGLQTAVLNRRGATTRAVDEGGVQEKELVEKYRRMAERVADGSPRTAVILRSLATSYEADARREERSAERFRRGLER